MKYCIKSLAVLAVVIMLWTIPVYGNSYQYDALNRVTQVTNEDGSIVTYTYDPNGNITDVHVTQFPDQNRDDEKPGSSVEFGRKEGNFTPAFSLKLLPIESNGHLKIECDFEIADNATRCHRSMFFVDAELGALERFVKKIEKIEFLSEEKCICLVDE